MGTIVDTSKYFRIMAKPDEQATAYDKTMCGFHGLLPEIWDHILFFIDDIMLLKSLSLVCTYFNYLTKNKLWKSIRLHKAYGIEVLSHLPIQELDLRHSGCLDSHLAAISKMSNLRKIDISGNNEITDEGITHLVQLPCLKSLAISYCSKITSDGLRLVSNLAIQSLEIRSICQDSHLTSIANIKSLHHLDLSHCYNIRGGGLLELKSIPNLKSLILSGIDMTWYSLGLQSIIKLHIQELDLQCCNCQDEHLNLISTMKCLEKLILYGNQKITDKGLSSLATLPQLRYLDVGRCPEVTSAGIAQLETVNPAITFACLFML